MRRILAGFVLTSMLTGGAAAEPADVLSSGSQPCGDFVAESGQGQELFVSCALGFITGQNFMDVSDMRLTGRGWTHDSVIFVAKKLLLAASPCPVCRSRGTASTGTGCTRGFASEMTREPSSLSWRSPGVGSSTDPPSRAVQ